MLPNHNADNLEQRMDEPKFIEIEETYIKAQRYHSPPFSPAAQTPQKPGLPNEESDIYMDQPLLDNYTVDNGNQVSREFQSAAKHHNPLRRNNGGSGLTDNQFHSTGGQNNKKQNYKIIREKYLQNLQKTKENRVQAHQSNFNSMSQASNENNQGISFYNNQLTGSNQQLHEGIKSSIDNSSFTASKQFNANQSPFEFQKWSHKKSAITYMPNLNMNPEVQTGVQPMPTVMATPLTKQLADRFSTANGKNLNSEGAFVSRTRLARTNAETINEDQETMNETQKSQAHNALAQLDDKENCNLLNNSGKDKRKVIHRLIEQQKLGLSSSRAHQKIKLSKNAGSINLLHKKLSGQKQHGYSPSFVAKSGGTKLDTSKGLNRAANLSTTIQPKALNFGVKNSNKKNSLSIENLSKNIATTKGSSRGLHLRHEPQPQTVSGRQPEDQTPRKAMAYFEVEPPKIIDFNTRFNLDFDQAPAADYNQVAQAEQDSHTNMINQLMLGESSVENTNPNASKVKTKAGHGPEPEQEAQNEQTMNSVTIKSNDSKKDFTKEREYDQAQLEIMQSINFHKQVSSASDALMRINSSTFNNKNEHTSSSLGKRNFNDFQNANKQASDSKKNQDHDLSRIEEDEAVQQRVTKTPARRLQRGRKLQRTHSDNFCVEQVQQSGKKLLTQDEESNPTDEIFPPQNGHILKLFQGQPSDIPMSSYDQVDNSNENSHNNINFQKMGYTGHNHHMAINKIPMQFSGNGSSFDNCTNNDNSDLNCKACQQERAMLGQHPTYLPMQTTFPVQGAAPATKETPVFNFKQPLDSSALLRQLTASKGEGNDKKPFEYRLQCDGANKKIEENNKQFKQLTLYEEGDNSDPRQNQEVVSEESEEGQFERDGDFINNEDPSTNIQTQGGKETEGRQKVEIHQHYNNFGQVFVNRNMSTMNTIKQKNEQFLLPLQQFQLLQQQQLSTLNQPFHSSTVIRQLSFRSNSNASSGVNTPIQKRVKVGSYHNSIAHSNRAQIPDQQMTTGQQQLQKSFTTKEGSPQSVYSRWRQADPILTNKYSSGLTPPQKRASLNSNNQMFFQEDCVPQKSQSFYGQGPGNQTMQSDQAQAQMLILSPNEQKAMNSENTMEDRMPEVQPRKFQIDCTTNRESRPLQRTITDDNINVHQLTLTKIEKSNSTSEQNMFAQTIPPEHYFFQSLNEKNLNANQHTWLLPNGLPRGQANHKSVSDPQGQMPKQQASQVLHQNVMHPSQNARVETGVVQSEPFQVAAQNNPFVNKWCKTQSSLSNTLSQHTCRHKPLNVNTHIEGRSTGGPKTPVQIKDRNSQASGTNTSMNQQSCMSSALDTDNQDYAHGKYSKNKRSKYHHFGGVNPGQVSVFQPVMMASSSSLQAMKPSILPAVSWFQQAGNRGSNSLFSGKSNSNQMNSSLVANQFQQFQPKHSLQTSQQLPFQVATTPQSKASWLEKEFTKISSLGSGHFGYVLRCRNNTDQFEYAIKVTFTRISNPSEQAQAQYLQEMQTLSALSVKSECPHIVRYFNSWIERDRIHIVMELCEKSLGQVKREAKLRQKKIQKQVKHRMSVQDFQSPEYAYEGYIPEEELMKIIRDLLLGLSELHGQDIVHLDIKPGNILLGKNNQYKLADLGMARFLTKLTDEVNIPEGDCRYLAKELLSREVLNYIPDLKKSDIFSLGITVYELLTLSNLEKNGPEWRSLRDGSFEYPPKVKQLYSDELLHTIRSMLAAKTDDRPTADALLRTVFVSGEQRQIQALQTENEDLKCNQKKLLDFLRQNGLDCNSILTNLDILQP